MFLFLKYVFMSNNKTIIVIAGATAVGKTNISIQLAKHYKTAVLSADSRQCYREMSIGTACPNIEEMDGIPHYFIHSHSIHEHLNVADYEAFALDTLSKLFNQHDVVIVCGGTGLYIDALCNGIDVMPDVDLNIKNKIQ